MISLHRARTLTTIALVPLLVGMVGCKSRESGGLDASVESAEATVKQSVERLPVVGGVVPSAISAARKAEAKLGFAQAKRVIRKDLSIAGQSVDALIARIKYVGSLPICPPGTPDNQSCDGSSSATALAAPSLASAKSDGKSASAAANTAPAQDASTQPDAGPSMDDLRVH